MGNFKGFLLKGRWVWLFLGLTVVLGGLAFLEYEKRPMSGEKSSVLLEITPGMSFGEIPEFLHKKGIIRNKWAFWWGALQKNAFHRIQAGEYELSPSMSVNEILDIFIKGLVKKYAVVVPEGFNVFDIARRLDEIGLCTFSAFLRISRDSEFLKRVSVEAESLEGYLFPDTYWFVKKTSVERIAEAMTRRFWQVWNENGYGTRAMAMNMQVKDVLTLASIIEKETGIREERPLVSAVLWNRLRKGIPLQADPTVIYGLLSENEPIKDTITAADLRTPTPYNTYVIKGMPKGPICNAGKASIEAALSPADVPYLYFVAQPDGFHHFSVDLKEHNAAVYRYRRGLTDK
ncbi:MAG: endolytic transglycosylase MltG [Dissulfuribacterales bacterium]